MEHYADQTLHTLSNKKDLTLTEILTPRCEGSLDNFGVRTRSNHFT